MILNIPITPCSHSVTNKIKCIHEKQFYMNTYLQFIEKIERLKGKIQNSKEI